MTTIAAVQGSSWAVIGFDSQVVEADGRRYELPSDAAKCVDVGEFTFGVAGDFRAINILTHNFTPPDLPKNSTTLDYYMTSKFIPALKTCFDRNFYGKDGENGCEIITVVRGIVYEIGSNYDCMRDKNGIYAIGSGSSFALGAMHAVDSLSKRNMTNAKEVVRAGLNSAVMFDYGTSNPTTVILKKA